MRFFSEMSEEDRNGIKNQATSLVLVTVFNHKYFTTAIGAFLVGPDFDTDFFFALKKNL